MKYENYNKVVSLVNLCESHKKSLAELEQRLVIRIHPHDDYRSALTTIGIDSDSEHKYAEYGRELVRKIKADLFRRIIDIEKEIETL